MVTMLYNYHKNGLLNHSHNGDHVSYVVAYRILLMSEFLLYHNVAGF